MIKLKRVLFIPDCHTPHHDKIAFNLMLDVASQFKPHEIVYLGDFIDASSVSFHDKDAFEERLLKKEIQEGRRILDEVDNLLKPKEVTFIAGNHTDRISRYISKNAPALAGIYSTREIVGIPSHYRFYEYGQDNYHKIGNLVCTHGYIAGENAAAAVVKKFRANVITGHVHRLQEVHITNIHGDDFVGITAGWLGNRRYAATYMKGVTDWSLGFVLGWFKSNGTFYYQLVHIKQERSEYSCMFNGEIFIG